MRRWNGLYLHQRMRQDPNWGCQCVSWFTDLPLSYTLSTVLPCIQPLLCPMWSRSCSVSATSMYCKSMHCCCLHSWLLVCAVILCFKVIPSCLAHIHPSTLTWYLLHNSLQLVVVGSAGVLTFVMQRLMQGESYLEDCWLLSSNPSWFSPCSRSVHGCIYGR